MEDGGSPCSLNEVNLGPDGAMLPGNPGPQVEIVDDIEEMNTASLSEVMAGRNQSLEELQLWALCRECCLTLEYVHDCHDLFQSLCITPDTVAFDPEGNVCFLDLDMEPDANYVSPETTQSGEHSFKSHLFSLGMTLLFATEYNHDDDARSGHSEIFTDLLSALTQDDSELRPDLDSVIESCERALGNESSQDVCLKIVGLQPGDQENVELKDKADGANSIQQMTDELSVYLQSQSGLVEANPPDTDSHSTTNTLTEKSPSEGKKDFNDNSVKVESKEPRESSPKKRKKTKSKVNEILRDVSFDEDDSMMSDREDSGSGRRAGKQKGVLLNDILGSINRTLDETELWSICREAVLTLHRKRKHLPAYISLETLMVRESGAISFKAIPEEQPLEVIYMAPELQSKGILSEKTCLYGLGVTLRSAAGGKYSTSLSIPDGEALEVILTSFLQLNQHKRPTLDTAMEMCEEYQKVTNAHSRDLCKRMVKEALEAVSCKSEASSQALNSKNSWDDSEIDCTTMDSTDNTQSVAQAGDTTEAEDNIDEIPYDTDQDDTRPSTATSFKPLSSPSKTRSSAKNTASSSAFKPVSGKTKPTKKVERVPSAYSSPHTHFKPIIIQDETNSPDPQSGSSSGKENDVVSKLRKIKDNLQRHASNDVPNKVSTEKNKLSNSNNASSGPLAPDADKSQQSGISLDQAVQQLQSQSNPPDTDALASAIAHYLKNHLAKSNPQGSVPSNESLAPTTAIGATSHQTRANSQITSTDANNVPDGSQRPTTSVHHGTPLVSTSTFSSSMSTPMYSFNPQVSPSLNTNNFSGGVPIQMNPPIHQAISPQTSTGIPPVLGPYPTPFPGMGQMPIQYTLMQDPTTGLMQMIPCMMPVSSQAQSVPPQNMTTTVNSHIAPMLENPYQAHPPHTYGTYSQTGVSRGNLHNANSTTHEGHRIPDFTAASAHGSHLHSQENAPLQVINRAHHSKHEEGAVSTEAVHLAETISNHPHNQKDSDKKKLTVGANKESESQSSSPSPSKDSGICLTQQPQTLPFSKDALMERLLSSHDSTRQRTLSQVLRIIREEFADDGVFDTGVEDLNIAEYILSLSSLTWETFRSAITEKFFHLVWTYELLGVLYERIGGSTSPRARALTKTPPAANTKPVFHPTETQAQMQTHLAKTCQRQSHQHHSQPPFAQPHLPTSHSSSNAPYPTSGPMSQHHPSSKGPNIRQPQQFQQQYLHQQHLRPRSEIGGPMLLWSETSDSTDTEARDKRRRYKKRGDLDKSKSSSLHNISAEPTAVTANETGPVNPNRDLNHLNPSYPLPHQRENPSVFSKDFYRPRHFHNQPLENHFTTPTHPSGSYAPYAADKPHDPSLQGNVNRSPPSATSTHTPVLSAFNPNKQQQLAKLSDPRSTNIASPASVHSHSSSSKSGSSLDHSQGSKLIHHTQSQPQPQRTNPPSSPVGANILPSKPTYSRTHSQPSSHLLSSREYAGSSSSNSPNEQQQTLRYMPHSQAIHPSTPSVKEPHRIAGSPPTSCRDADDLDSHDASVEMRKLAAKKPELFQDMRSSKNRHSQELAAGAKPSDRSSIGSSVANPNSLNTSFVDHDKTNRSRSATHDGNPSVTNYYNSRLSAPDHNPNRLNSLPRDNKLHIPSTISTGAISQYEPSTGVSKTREDYMGLRKESPNLNNSFSNDGNFVNNAGRTSQGAAPPQYGRSLSAVYTRHQHPQEKGVSVMGSSGSSPRTDFEDVQQSRGHQRRGSDGSFQLSELNSALLPYSNKGQIVYHSAMIQLSLTPEVDDFIHSIDEENKRAIETRLASIKQEMTMQQRQRKKTQRFYRKLNDQGSDVKTTKADQAISEQMLKDMTEMTRKISFLQLCQTHLQMLLAELYGLDTCFLYSLAATELGQQLVLQPIVENEYLQFRTVNTVEAGQMTVLQAGTPRGLMSYLYTSSALSDGYIHQFLMCFRYILTAEQLLNFILEKFRSAQSHHGDLNMLRVLKRSLDLLHVWLEGYFSIDFYGNKKLLRKFADFVTEQNDANTEGAEELFSLYAACRMGEHTELMLMTDMDDDEEEGSTYFLHLANPKRSRAERLMEWESFRSLLKRSKSEKGSSGSSGKSRSEFQGKSLGGLLKPAFDFNVVECEPHTLAEQLTLMEQSVFRKCHPIHFLNSQSQGVGVALSMPGLRTPSMSRKLDPTQTTKKGLFVGDPALQSGVVHMIAHSQEVSHWVAAEVLSCGSNKSQASLITKFLTVGHMCLEVKNYATSLSILEGLENLVVRQLPVWKNIGSKYMSYLDGLTAAKMKLKGESLALMSEKDCHVYPTIPCALFLALHLQQAEIGGFTLANGMFKWDKMRCISEVVDQARIFRDHEYGFRPDKTVQSALKRRLENLSDQDLHTVASAQDNNFRRHSSSSSLSGTFKKVKDKLGSKKK